MLFMVRPVKSIGRTCGRARAVPATSGPRRSIRSSPTTPQTMCPCTMNASPPNIFCSVTSAVSASTSRMRSASVSSYAISLSSVGTGLSLAAGTDSGNGLGARSALEAGSKAFEVGGDAAPDLPGHQRGGPAEEPARVARGPDGHRRAPARGVLELVRHLHGERPLDPQLDQTVRLITGHDVAVVEGAAQEPRRAHHGGALPQAARLRRAAGGDAAGPAGVVRGIEHERRHLG